MTRDEILIEAQKAQDEHWQNAISDDYNRAHYLSPVYQRTDRLVKAWLMILCDGDETKAERVKYVMLDCNESVKYCLEYVEQEARDLAAQEAESAALES